MQFGQRDCRNAESACCSVVCVCVCVCVCFPLRPAALNALRGEDPPLCLIINYQAKSSSHQPISFSLLTLVQKIVFALSHLMYFVGYRKQLIYVIKSNHIG